MNCNEMVLRPYKVGLTGGISCGKTVISQCFENLNVPVIDADKISREVVQVNSPTLKKLEQRFGSTILNEDSSLNRAKLRQIVFSDPKALSDLNFIMHPAIHNALKYAVEKIHNPYVVIVIPLLFENKLQWFVDRVLVADASELEQIKRTVQRDQCTEDIVKNIIKNQVPREIRVGQADDLIETDVLSLEEIKEKVDFLHQKYTTLARVYKRNLQNANI